MQAGKQYELRYADHMFIQIYFRMHHIVVKFSEFSSPQAAKGHWPLTKSLRTPLVHDLRLSSSLWTGLKSVETSSSQKFCRYKQDDGDRATCCSACSLADKTGRPPYRLHTCINEPSEVSSLRLAIPTTLPQSCSFQREYIRTKRRETVIYIYTSYIHLYSPFR